MNELILLNIYLHVNFCNYILYCYACKLSHLMNFIIVYVSFLIEFNWWKVFLLGSIGSRVYYVTIPLTK